MAAHSVIYENGFCNLNTVDTITLAFRSRLVPASLYSTRVTQKYTLDRTIENRICLQNEEINKWWKMVERLF